MTEKELRKLFDSLSIEEKLGEVWQIQNQVFDKDGAITGDLSNVTYTPEQIYSAGSTLNLFGIDKLKKVQDEHIKNHPHHIPMMFMADIIHGFATILPEPLAQSCSFDPALVKKANRMVAKESSVSGLHITFYPMMDLVRDPRWGRVIESGGEDPHLCYELCKAIVEGLQGDGLDKPYTLGACIKHFAGYGAAEGGRDYNTCDVGERNLRNYYLKGYKGGIDAGASMVMTSFNVLDGVPSSINKWLFKNLLKDEWGFDGVVITDIWTIGSMGRHRIGSDGPDDERYRAEKTFEAGIDISMVSETFDLKRSIEEGRLDPKVIDEACWRVLKLKNNLGLFENPYRCMNKDEAEEILLCDEHLEIAKELALESCVLLKNDNKTLPLNPNEKIAFIGPMVDTDEVNGSWVLTKKGADKVVDTLHTAIDMQYPVNNFVYARGCSALGREDARIVEVLGHCDEETREQTISEAVEIAKNCDTVVLTLGEIAEMFGEANSRANIKIPEVQLELFRRVREVAKKVVVLLYNGRPLDLTDIQSADAILDVWYLGSKMNEAITDLIFGKESPSGRLSMTFPMHVGQVPLYYNYLPTDHPKNKLTGCNTNYVDDGPAEPRYHFGYGLTYSNIKYGKTTFDKTHFGPDDIVVASAEITNAGDRDVTEVVQLYIRDYRASISRPEKELKGFKRVHIKAGETIKVDFEINEEMLRYYNIDMEYASDAGEFDVIIAPDSSFLEWEDMLPIYLEK